MKGRPINEESVVQGGAGNRLENEPRNNPWEDNTALRPTPTNRRPCATAFCLGCGDGDVRFPKWTGGGGGGVLRISSYAFRARAAVWGRGKAYSSFYELLGIPESRSFYDIKRAYKQRVLKYHPDVSPPDRVEEYTQRFIEVQEAYETLSDPRLRAFYDRDLARGFHLAFSARRRVDEEMEEKSGWKSSWQDQLAGLKKRSVDKDSEGILSWGARMEDKGLKHQVNDYTRHLLVELEDTLAMYI